MSAEPKPDFSEFADLADTLRKQRLRSEQVVRRALNRAKAHYPVPLADELNGASRALDIALDVEHRGAFTSALMRSLSPGMVSDWPATLLSKDGPASKPCGCRMRIRAVAASGATTPTALYWNFTEETDEDLF